MRFREFEDSSATAGHASQRIVGDERRQPGLFHDQFIDVAQQCTSTRKHDTALRHIAAEIRRRLLERLSRRGGFARSNTQLFDNAFEDRLFLTQGLQPLVLLGFDDFLSQFGDVEFKRAPHGVALWLGEVE